MSKDTEWRVILIKNIIFYMETELGALNHESIFICPLAEFLR